MLRSARDRLALLTVRRCRSCGTTIDGGRTSCAACGTPVRVRRGVLGRLAP